MKDCRLNHHIARIAWIALVIFAHNFALAGEPRPAASRYVEGELLVKFKGGPRGDAAARAKAAIQHDVKRHFDFIGWQQIKLPAGISLEEGLVRYRNSPEVVAAEPNYIIEVSAEGAQTHRMTLKGNGGVPVLTDDALSDDALSYTQWSLDRIGAPLAWTVSTGSTNVVVAILNTGMNYLHEDLRDNMWRNPGEIPGNGIDDDGNGYVDDVYGIDTADDRFGNDTNPWDEGDWSTQPGQGVNPIYRGSAVGSIVGAVANNGVGIAGINWNVRLMALRAVTTNGTMSFADEIEAVNYLVLMKNRGVNIRAVQISNSGTTFSAAAKAAYDAASNAGILFAVGVGLNSADLDITPRYPPCYDSPGIIAVTPSTVADRLLPSGNFGRVNVDLAAPGLSIIQASGPGTNDYEILEGTSQAAAQVAGAAGLLAAAYPKATAQQIKEALLESVDVLPAFTNKMVSNGRLNLARALFHRNFVSNAAPMVVTPPQSQTALPGSLVTFRVSTAGTEPLRYVWQRDGVDVVQSSNPTLTLTNAVLADAGEYRIVVTNAFGSVTSAVARLLVQPEPVTFTKITTGPHVTTAGNNVSFAWGDFNNDNFPDLFVAREGGGNLLYRNNGNGTFAAVNAGVSDVANSWACGWGDYDRDGFLDLFVGNGGNSGPQDDFLYHNNGDGTFTRMTTNNAGTIVAGGGASTDCAWADFDRDGFLDVFVVNGSLSPQAQLNSFYRNLGDGRFGTITQENPSTDAGHSLGIAWGDYDNDGWPDLFVANRMFEQNYLYRNIGGGDFLKISANSLVWAVGHFIGGAWGDYDNDGDLDLIVCREGQPLLFRNDGPSGLLQTIEFTPIPLGTMATDWITASGCAWGDYDNDGFLDLIIGSESELCVLYHNNGDGSFRRVTTGALATDFGTWFGCAWADYDRDGFLDLYVVNYGGANALHHNNGNTNRWLQVKLLGTASNRSGVGAKVRVQATIRGREIWQLREIGAGDGIAGQNELIAAFGLGDATNVPMLRIEWPSGTVQELQNVNPNQFLTITEPVFSIARQPQDVLVRLGNTTNLSAIGYSDRPVNYQWRFNGTNLLAETNSNLLLTNIQLAREGDYTVIVNDSTHSLTSRTARLAILINPGVVQPPLSQSVVVGGNVTVSVVITGNPPPFLYQWRRQVGAVTVLTNIVSNERVCFFTLSHLQTNDSGLYRVVVTNAAVQTLSVNASFTLTVLADANTNGLPDDWEALFAVSDAVGDPDHDGLNNLQEYLAGTDPTNRLSLLKIDQFLTNGLVALEFSAVSNKTYSLQFTDALGIRGWTNLADITARSSNRIERVIDPNPSASRFYRLVTPRQP